MWRSSVFGCYLILVGCSQALFINDSLVVQTQQGPVRGVHATDGNFSLFMGIPYASVDPNNKFGPAQAPPTWTEIRDVDDDSTRCPQREEFNHTLTGVADCLVLHVYVPDSASLENPLPVMFYIHGGTYVIGWGGRFPMLGPQYLMDRQDVVLVSINYRLGAYGFLCLGIEGAPGNVGFKDQVAALRWVQNNIAGFGGDPNSVTIFGNSAGASSVEFQVLSPLTQGLFHRAITESGTAIAPLMKTGNEPINRAKLLAAQLGNETDNVDELLEYLETFELLDLVVATEEAGVSFLPCVESKIENLESFLLDTPLNILRSGDYKPVPYLAGFNDKEGLAFISKNISLANTTFETYIPGNLPYKTEEERNGKIELIKEFYVGDGDWEEDSLYPLIDFITDSNLLPHIEKSLRFHLNWIPEVYYYEMAYHGHLGAVSVRENITLPGVAHADELGYLFVQGTERYQVSPADQLIVDRLTTMWTNFAKYGNPTPEVTDLLPIEWEPATADSIKYIHIDTNMTMRHKPYRERVAFWNMIYLNQTD